MNNRILLSVAVVCATEMLVKGAGAELPPIEKDCGRALSVLAENVYGVRPSLKDFRKMQLVVETVDVPELGAVSRAVRTISSARANTISASRTGSAFLISRNRTGGDGATISAVVPAKGLTPVVGL